MSRSGSGCFPAPSSKMLRKPTATHSETPHSTVEHSGFAALTSRHLLPPFQSLQTLISILQLPPISPLNP
ncbi:hypothetical protein TB2_032300 [Malus domestica]